MTCRHSHTPQVQVTLGALCWTVILHLWHARRHKTSHKERKEKKKPRWHRRLIPPLSPKKTHKRKLGAFFSPREHTTSKCQRAEPLLGLMWNDVPAAMHHPPGEGGSRGPPPAARSICVRGAAEFWPLRPVEEMDLLQAPLPAPTNYQSDTHTHTHTRQAWQQGSCGERCAAEHRLIFIFIHYFRGGLQKRTSSRTLNHLILTRFSLWCRSWHTKGVHRLIKSDTRSF